GFNAQAGLEDLLQSPYDAGKYKNAFTEQNWTRWMSIDETKLLAMPGEHMPSSMYYRDDILDDYGYPTEPEELATYLESTENFIEMAQAFKGDNKWVTTYRTAFINDNIGDRGYFDKDLNYTRTGDKFVEVLDLTKQLAQLDLISNMMIVW